ncbi:MAG: flagellar biosynthesis protein FlhB [Gammaproteobacteria bacterium]|nr:flagellar biosynthesis protein FlhB [Gammaproteobacteria bacterium]
MAEDTGQERTEQPTPRRIQQAREKGQIPTSRELNTMLMMLIAGASVMLIGPSIVHDFLDMFRRYLNVSRENIFDITAMPVLLETAIIDALITLAPFFALMIIAAVAGPLMMGGITFSTQALSFKWDKLNPVTGLGRVFSKKGLVELLKALAKFIIIGTTAILFLYTQIDVYLGLGDEPLVQALPHMANLLIWSFLAIASVLVFIALVDVPFQVWDYTQQLKMTFQEIKDENKDTEGNPEVRSRVKRVQQEMAQRRMMAEVPKADVIITNPEHYSVAIKYDQENMAAPIVVAKGVDLIAMQIRTIAREHEVPILQAPPLARALHHTTEIDQEIPASLYLAVAQVLAYIFKLRTDPRWNKRKQEHKLNDLPIPDDMKFEK